MTSFADIQSRPISMNGTGKKRIVQYNYLLDGWRRYLTDSPTPQKFGAWLKLADRGDIAALWEMQEEMEAKDAWLKAVTGTRRRAITALEWEIEPDEEAKDIGAAEAAAEYCDEKLSEIGEFPTTLEFLQKSIGPNVAIVELLWEKAELVGMVDVPGHRLRSDPIYNYGVYIRVNESPLDLIPTDQPQGKWIVYHHDWNGGFPFRSTYTHATVVPWIIKHFSLSDWKSFLEIYGMPWRFATMDETVTPDDRNTIEDMLNNMGSDTAAAFPKGTTVDMLEVTGKGEAFKEMLDMQNKTLSVLYLGQNLTTDVGAVGSHAAAQVHDNVRLDLLQSDLACEARTLRSQLLKPMIDLKFPGKDMPIPYFCRQYEKVRNLEADRLDMDRITMARTMGLPISVDDVYQKLDMIRPAETEKDVLFTEPVATPEPYPGTGKTNAGN